MNEKTYILTQILEDDYGCEERPAGQAVTVLAPFDRFRRK